ncbi:hypothetical protein E9232_006852 [Inquilinus ginsengisoli]|uniref:Uncharacterized protein n=1 Tax=Inquilinus ginsengisoli TaxID=363840 RepID=A0ABU1K098_9PROT|nr:hypothetical protein [Inquilinus ginsengisoli]MDR6294298.1 hypothetical protein [Inquilinus ginsengisoli]
MVDVVNQTNPRHLAKASPGEKGTGIFAIPDPTSSNFGAAQVVEVSDITYDECIARGEFTLGFKWIPQSVAQTVGPCVVAGQPCVKDCGDDAHCICVKGRCVGLP